MPIRPATGCLLPLALTLALAASAAPASGHGSQGQGVATKRDCGAMKGPPRQGPVGVGATRVSCRIARIVVAGSVRNQRFERWTCVGRGTRLGHCHGRGVRHGAVVSWYVHRIGPDPSYN